MRKILFYIDCMQMGGANRVMANLVNHFSKKGWNIILVNDIHPESDVPEYFIESAAHRMYLDESSLHGLKKNFHRIAELRKIIRREQPDAILSFMGPPNIRALISTIGVNTKKIVSVRNDPYREYGEGIKKLLARIIFRFADGYVFQTEEASRYFSGSIRKKSKVIFNPVNERFFDCSWEKKKNEIAVVGRLQEQKNPLLALSAFAIIADRFPDYKLVYYGSDELSKDIDEKKVELNIEQQVRIYGKTSHVEKHLSESALYLLSSDYEGMPNALMEAMAVGIPVIATDCPCGGPRTLIQNNSQGMLVPCGDKTSMSEAIAKVLSNSRLQETMSLEERKRAEAFRPEAIFKQWENYMISVINAK